jgi:hypothetical protein
MIPVLNSERLGKFSHLKSLLSFFPSHQMVYFHSFLKVEVPGNTVENSSLNSAEVQNGWKYHSFPQKHLILQLTEVILGSVTQLGGPTV